MLLCAMLLMGPVSSAEAQLPPICQEYADLPVCNQGEEDDDGPDGPIGIPGPDDTAGGGTLPFTGYPITPIVLVALLLLIAALLLRGAIAVNDRMQARTADGGPDPLHRD